MTNGEKLKEVFGVKDEQIRDGIMFVTVDGFDCPKDNFCGAHDFFKNWWNAEYKEPTTKNNLAVDCVSRAEMLKYQQYLHGKMSNEENHKLWEFIKELPSVTPIRPKGHWIPKNDDYCDWYECSECGYGDEGEMYCDSEHDVRTNYCPYCGADMREAEE